MNTRHGTQPPASRRAPLDEHEEQPPPNSAPAVTPVPRAAANAPILVIDDSDIAREEITRTLREAGWQVVALRSPIGATQAIVRHQARVVVVDVFMPTIRGDRLLTLFRKNPRLGHLSVILVSGHSEQELERLQLEVAADAVVSKRNLERLPAIVKRFANKDR